MRLTERDFIVMQQITKYRFATGRQIKVLAEFSSLNTCDRRLKKLIEAGYIKRQYFLYGVPALYFTTKLAQRVFNLDYISDNVRVDKVEHDISVIDTAIYFITNMGINETDIITERELKHEAGFCTQKHRPDFICKKENNKICVEIELTEKNRNTFEENVKKNYLDFDTQYWVTDNPKVKRNLIEMQQMYSDIKIIELKEVQEYVKNL